MKLAIRVLCILSALAMIVAMAGCAGDKPDTSDESSKEDTRDFGGRTFKIGAWWDIAPKEGRSEMEDAYYRRIQEIEDENNCTIEFVQLSDTTNTYITTTLAGSPAVDIGVALSYDILPGFIEGGIAYPLSDLKAFNFDDAKWSQSMYEFGLYNGKAYTMDLKVSMLGNDTRYGVFYNKSMFEDQGLQDLQELYKAGNWTWDKFLEVAQAVKWDVDSDGVADIYPVMGENLMWNFIYSNGGDVLNKSDSSVVAHNFDAPEVVEAMEYAATFIDSVENISLANTDTDFAAGTVAMFVGEWWQTGVFCTKDGVRQMMDNYSFVPFPKGKSATEYYSYGKECSPYFMLKTVKNPEDVAWVFDAITDYAETDDDWTNWLETQIEVQADDAASVDNVVGLMNAGNITINPTQGFSTLYNAVTDMLNAIANSEMTAQVALETYTPSIEAAVKEAGEKDWEKDFENKYGEYDDSDIEFEEVAATGRVHYSDFEWGVWTFSFSAPSALKDGKVEPVATSGEAYTHGDLLIVTLDEDTTFQKVVIKSEAAGEMPLTCKIEYTVNPLDEEPTNIPDGTVSIKEYKDYYDAATDTLTLSFPEPVTARTFWVQGFTAVEGGTGDNKWTASEIHLYKAK